MEPRRLRFYQEQDVLKNEDDYIDFFREINGLTQVEFTAMQKMINLDLNSENMNNLHFLRL